MCIQYSPYETQVDIMNKSSCELLLHYYPKVTDFEELRSTYIANCVLNNFLSYTVIMLNIVTIHAIRKTSSLPNTLKTLLLNLAVSDIAVGLLVQPFYTSLLVKWLQKNHPSCNTYMVFVITTSSFYQASFFGVVALSLDRFLAIHLHLRYQELVTHKRVIAVVISIWLLSVLFPCLVFWVSRDILLPIELSVGGFCLLLTTVAYIRIYLAVRRHKNQIQVLQVQDVAESGEIANFASLIKSAVGLFYVYLVFLICYLPYLVGLVAFDLNGPSISLKRFSLFSWILVYLNSSLNPIIYCWKMRHIRHAVMDILRNIPWFRNSATQ